MRFSINLPKTLFILALASIIFGYGLLVGKYKILPYSLIKSVVDSTKLVTKEFGMITRTKPDSHLFPARYEGNEVVQYKSDLMAPGLTLITSLFEDELQIRLLTHDGSVVNRWQISIHSIWDNFDYIMPESERPMTDWNIVFNGVSLLPDGSVVFPMGGLVKMDRCGSVVWKVPHMVHHSLEPTSRGSYWTAGRYFVAEKSEHMPIKAPYEIDTILEVAEDGEILREIAILDILWKNDMLSLLFSNNRGFDPNPSLDVIHLNDVEEIPVEFIDSFPLFDAGDLLISLRQMNMVMVIDPDTSLIKWHQIGPWIQQHDVDWQPNGTFTIFDNRTDGSLDGEYFGGSKVLSIDPVSREVQYLYGDRKEQVIYTASQGDQQVLANGNILIVESEAGRVIEVMPSGEIVWEYINRYSEEDVIRIPDAIRYPPDYLKVDDWLCK